MIRFHKSSMPCMDASHYFAYCDDNTTVGDVIDAALNQVVNEFRNNNGFDPNQIKFEVRVNYNDGWVDYKVADGQNDAVVPDEIRSLLAECTELVYWARGYEFTLSLYGRDRI